MLTIYLNIKEIFVHVRIHSSHHINSQLLFQLSKCFLANFIFNIYSIDFCFCYDRSLSAIRMLPTCCKIIRKSNSTFFVNVKRAFSYYVAIFLAFFPNHVPMSHSVVLHFKEISQNFKRKIIYFLPNYAKFYMLFLINLFTTLSL